MSHQVSEKSVAVIDWPVFVLSGGFLMLFVATALFDIELLSATVNGAFGGATKLFGAYWQVLMLLTFLVALMVAISDSGKARLGNLEAPDISTYKWVAIIMCTLLAGGGVFWAAAEPMAHFISSPPLFGVESASPEAVYPALAQSYMHWGFLSWSILGSLTAIIFMYLHYDKGLPLKPRILLYPLFGERVLHGWLGAFIDAACVVAVVSGTVGPIGFLGLQVSFGLSELFGLTNDYSTQLLIILGLIAIYTVSAVSGVTRGIQILSSFNIGLSIVDKRVYSHGQLSCRQRLGKWLDSVLLGMVYWLWSADGHVYCAYLSGPDYSPTDHYSVADRTAGNLLLVHHCRRYGHCL